MLSVNYRFLFFEIKLRIVWIWIFVSKNIDDQYIIQSFEFLFFIHRQYFDKYISYISIIILFDYKHNQFDFYINHRIKFLRLSYIFLILFNIVNIVLFSSSIEIKKKKINTHVHCHLINHFVFFFLIDNAAKKYK